MGNWVSVDEKLPEDNSCCLVTESGGVYYAWYDLSEKVFMMVRYANDNQIILDGVTHWMKIPKIPN